MKKTLSFILFAVFFATQSIAATSTTNYTLIKPAINDPVDADRWGNQWNDNADTLDTELYQSQYGISAYAVSTGASPNVYELDYTPDVTALTAGLELSFKAHQDNTGVSTLNVDGLGAVVIKKDISVDLAAGDVKTGLVVTVVYDGTNFQLKSRALEEANVITTRGDIIRGDTAGAAERLAIGAAGMSLVSDGTDAVWGFPFKNYQVFSTAGVDTFNTPAGVTKVAVAVWGAGGGGGAAVGNYSAGEGIIAYGGGGGAGGFTFGIVTPGASETVTIGTGGAGGTAPNVITANDGADGGASSFGALLSATGGKGGQGAYIKNGYGGIGGLGSLGLYNSKGEEGANGATKNNFEQYRTNDERNIDILTDEFNTGYSGRGGMPALGGQYGEGVAIGNDGNDGEYGAGGSGGASENSVSLQDGGDGGDGLVIVFW